MKLKYVRLLTGLTLTAALLLSMLLLPGCRSSGLGEGQDPFATNGASFDPTVTTEPSRTLPTESTTVPPEPTTVPTEPVLAYITPTEYPKISTYGYNFKAPELPIPSENAPEAEWIAFFYGLFSAEDSWYAIGLNSFYETTADMELDLLFAVGVTFSGVSLTEEERTFLNPWPDSVYHRMPKAEVESVLGIYFGTSLEKCSKTETWAARYFEKTNCYYISNNGAPIRPGVPGIIGYRVLENGDYAVRYMSDLVEFPYGVAEAVLRRCDNYFQIISNQIVE